MSELEQFLQFCTVLYGFLRFLTISYVFSRTGIYLISLQNALLHTFVESFIKYIIICTVMKKIITMCRE